VFDVRSACRWGMGPLCDIRQRSDTELKIPLGKIVFVRGGTEAQRLTFVSLLAKVIQPTSGQVLVPPAEWPLLMPIASAAMPSSTVAEDFILNGATPEAAANLASILCLDPHMPHSKLPSGQAGLHALGRYLLQDPGIFIVVRPLSVLPQADRTKALLLLMAWCMGGGGHTLSMLLEREGLRDCGTSVGRSGRFAGSAPPRRTLVMAGEEIPSILPAGSICDVNLDEILEPSDHAETAEVESSVETPLNWAEVSAALEGNPVVRAQSEEERAALELVSELWVGAQHVRLA